MSLPGWLYRPEQLRKALSERHRPVSTAFVATWLDPAAQSLFWATSSRDRAHSAATAALLARDITVRRELVAAALLHDCGKGPQTILQRVFYVLASAFGPTIPARIARQGSGTRGALYRSLNHPSLGATLAANAGCSEEVCRLIADHHREPSDAESRALRWADGVA